MNEHFLVNDINDAQIHLNIIDQLADEIEILVGKSEYIKVETLIKQQLISVREVKRLQRKAEQHYKFEELAEKMSKRGVTTEVVHYVR